MIQEGFKTPLHTRVIKEACKYDVTYELFFFNVTKYEKCTCTKLLQNVTVKQLCY
jgi:hypothetical protein